MSRPEFFTAATVRYERNACDAAGSIDIFSRPAAGRPRAFWAVINGFMVVNLLEQENKKSRVEMLSERDQRRRAKRMVGHRASDGDLCIFRRCSGIRRDARRCAAVTN